MIVGISVTFSRTKIAYPSEKGPLGIPRLGVSRFKKR